MRETTGPAENFTISSHGAMCLLTILVNTAHDAPNEEDDLDWSQRPKRRCEQSRRSRKGIVAAQRVI